MIGLADGADREPSSARSGQKREEGTTYSKASVLSNELRAKDGSRSVGGVDLKVGFFRFPPTMPRMPTYEYVCEKCGHQFEKSQSMTAKPLAICPQELCHLSRWGKGKVKRAISGGAGLIFKGSGFYITDYRSDKYKEAAKKDVAPSSSEPSKSGGDSKSSSTPAKSSETKSEKKPSPPPSAGKN